MSPINAFWIGDPNVTAGLLSAVPVMLTKTTRRGMDGYWKKNRKHSKKEC